VHECSLGSRSGPTRSVVGPGAPPVGAAPSVGGHLPLVDETIRGFRGIDACKRVRIP